MKRRAFITLALATSFIASCSSKFKSYNGPQVTRVVVQKSKRKMWLMHNKRVLKTYKVDLGFAPRGHKQFEGDGKTPEGSYFINRRNPKSKFFLSLGISYPNAKDKAYARANGKTAGGDIFIHGGAVLSANKNQPDWTAGCISVSNKEMRTIYAMVENGTQIDILP